MAFRRRWKEDRPARRSSPLSWPPPSSASAHPHVWVTMRSQVAFTPDGKVSERHPRLDLRRNVFLLRHPGPGASRPIGQTRGFCAARQGKRRLARPDRLFHDPEDCRQGGRFRRGHGLLDGGTPGPSRDFSRRPAAQEPTPPGKFFSLLVADPEFFIDFEFDDKDGVKLDSAPAGCSLSVAKPKPLEADESSKLTESFFSGLAPGHQFRLQNGEPRHHRLPMRAFIEPARALRSRRFDDPRRFGRRSRPGAIRRIGLSLCPAARPAARRPALPDGYSAWRPGSII